MTHNFTTVLILLLPLCSLAQEVSLVRTDTVSIPFVLTEQADQLYLQYDSAAIDNKDKLISLLQPTHLKLERGNLRLNYFLSPPRNDFYYQVQLELENLSKYPISPNREQIEGQLNEIVLPEQQIIWQDVLSSSLMYQQTHYLKIQYQLYGKEISCDDSPPFFRKKRDKIIAISLAGVGFGLLTTAALIQRPKYNEQYEDYRNSWLLENDSSILSDKLSEAVRQQERYNTLNTFGLGFLAADALVLTFNLANYSNRKKAYKQYCSIKK
ncbi:MAG: hypothetical protein AAGG68_08085 [Bacteroidota bacterium]